MSEIKTVNQETSQGDSPLPKNNRQAKSLSKSLNQTTKKKQSNCRQPIVVGINKKITSNSIPDSDFQSN